MAQLIRSSIWEDSGCTSLARVLDHAGVAITQAALTTITSKVFDLDHATTPETPITTPTVTIASSVYDTLQTDAIWTRDTTGYNFKHALAATNFPTGDHQYRVEYKFTPTVGEAFHVVFEIWSKAIMGS